MHYQVSPSPLCRRSVKGFGPGSIAAVLLATGWLWSSSATADPPTEMKKDPDEIVMFPSFDGSPPDLTGYVWKPPGPGPHPAIVAMHGCGGVFASNGNIGGKFRYYGKILNEQGFLMLLVDGFSPRGAEECEDAGAPDPVLERPFDAHAGLAYLRERATAIGDVIPDYIGLLGWSGGGSAVISTSALSPQAPMLGAGVFSAVGDIEQMRREGFRAAVAVYPGCGQWGYYNGEYENYPVLRIFIGEDDTSVDPANCIEREDEALARGSDFSLFIYPGQGHGYDYDFYDQPAAVDTLARILETFRFYVGSHAETGIFEDGFERGDAGLWSAAVGLDG